MRNLLAYIFVITITVMYTVSCSKSVYQESREWATTLVEKYPDNQQTFSDSMMIIFIESDEFMSWYQSDYLGTRLTGTTMDNDRVMRSMTTTIQTYSDAKYYEDEWRK